MKKISLCIVSAVLFVCSTMLAFVTGFASEKSDQNPAYILSAYDFTYGKRTNDPNNNYWFGAPGDESAFVIRYEGSVHPMVNPGRTYQSAITFTAPCDGTISPKDGLGIGNMASQYDYKQGYGDGVRAAVFLNNQKIFPADSEWKQLTPSGLNIVVEEFSVTAGDKLRMVIESGGNGNSDWDTALCAFLFNWKAEGASQAVAFDSNDAYWTNAETDGNRTHAIGYKNKDLLSFNYVLVNEYKETADAPTEGKKVTVTFGDFQYVEFYGSYVWGGNEADPYCYFAFGNVSSPGRNYAVGVSFVAPCDGTISNALGCGSVYRSETVAGTTDKTRISVVLNNEVIYPQNGVWADVPSGINNALDIVFNKQTLQQGDKLTYIVDNGGNGNSDWDSTVLDVGFLWQTALNPDGTYVTVSENYWTNAETDGKENVRFGEYAKKDVFQYNYVTVSELVETPDVPTEGVRVLATLGEFSYVELAGSYVWGGLETDPYCYFAFGDVLAPGTNYAAAVMFTAPCDGVISNVFGNGTVYRSGEEFDGSDPEHPATDKTRISVVLNNEIIYPANGMWQDVPQGADNALDIIYNKQTLKQGDQLIYIVDNGGSGNAQWDSTFLDVGFLWIDEKHPTGTFVSVRENFWTDGETDGRENSTFGEYAKKDVFSYHYASLRRLNDNPNVETEGRKIRTTLHNYVFTELNGSHIWGGVATDPHCYFAFGNVFSPGPNYAAAVLFTAPCDGTISNALGCGTIYRNGQEHSGDNPDQPPTDKVRISVLLNDVVVYPAKGIWADVPQGVDNKLEIIFNTIEVKAGDRLVYMVDNGGAGNAEWDETVLDAGFMWIDKDNPNGVYVGVMDNYWENEETDGKENATFGNYAKKSVFSYHYVDVNECNPVGEAVEYVGQTFTEEYSEHKLRYSETDNRYYDLVDANLRAFQTICDTGLGYSLGIKWTAPETGRVDLSKSYICNYMYRDTPDAGGFRSDGVRFMILLNGSTIVYPSEDTWFTIKNAEKYMIEMAPFKVNKGDEIMLIFDRNGTSNYDVCELNIIIDFAKDGESYTDTYDRVKNFHVDDEYGNTWGYYAIEFTTEEEVVEMDPLAVVPFVKSGCSASFAKGTTLFAVLPLVLLGAVLTVRKGKERTK